MGRLQALAEYGVQRTYRLLPADKQDNFKDAIQRAVAGLKAIGTTPGQLTLYNLIEVLRQSGVTKIDDGDAQMIIADGKFLLSFVGAELAVKTPAEVELFRAALETGLAAGLAAL